MPEYLQPYEEAVATHGPGFRATLWRESGYQRTRFRVMAELLGAMGLANPSLVDAGCGLADFAAYLHEQRVPFQRYLGVEGVAEMADAARQRGLADVRIRVADFAVEPQALLPSPVDEQVLLFSGSLNSFRQEPALAVLDRVWAAGPRALIFNFLSDANRLPPAAPGDPAHRFDTRALLNWAFDCTPRVAFRQDYFEGGHDATIAMLPRVPPVRTN